MKNLRSIFLVVLTAMFVWNLSSQNKAFEVKVVGQGEPLLFFPGFTCTDKVWEEQVAELSKEYQCHLFTFAGFGAVTPIEFPWYPKIEKEVLDYIKENSLEKATAIGHSLGGTLALSLAAKEPLFEKLIIVDALTASGALMFPDYKSENLVYESPYNNQVLAMNAADFKSMAIQMALGMTSNQDKRNQIIEWMEMADRETYVYGYIDYLKVDLREKVSAIQIPVTILAATQPFGEQIARKTYEEQYKNLTNYELIFAEGASHFIMYDKPDWFLNTLKSKI
ncbi:alpha/beta hydrolase [Croceitalea sp. P059]|uniref:alpha/beta fold hydrolase n=1 Tax=Croceitalea sp. P059 TaxID=3075601 RepID=UPI0028854A0E|nr:alpha/beta hydrolase [Croceitalea sp. P059]MDT0538755.1 alpha/beta hydrolase [Croceitalea sp. P059]